MSRSRLLLAGLCVVAFTTIIVAILRKQPTKDVSAPLSSPSSSPVIDAQFNFSSPDTSTALTANESAIIDQTVSNLAMLARRSRTAAALLDFYRQNAVRCHIRSDGSLVTVEPNRSKVWFSIVAVEQPFHPKASTTLVAAMFMATNRTMVISPSTHNRICGGIVFAHELVHAQDVLLGGQKISPTMSDPWLLAEWHAFATIRKVLNEYTQGAWQQALNRGDRDRTEVKRKTGRPPDYHLVALTQADISYLTSALGPLTQVDLRTIIIQYTIDVNTAVMRRKAGSDSTLFTNNVLYFLRNLYQLNERSSKSR